MLRNFNLAILDMAGNAIKDEENKAVTLGTVCVNALLSTAQSDTTPGQEKAARYKLAMKIHGEAGDVDVTAEDISRMKDLCGKIYGPLVVGRVWELLEQSPSEVKAA